MLLGELRKSDGRSVGRKPSKSTLYIASRWPGLKDRYIARRERGKSHVSLVATPSAKAEPFARAWALAASLGISKTPGEVIAILALTPILLAVALWNGYPLIFYDTGAYVLEGLGHVFVAERGPVYSFLLRYAGAARSLWYIALLQAGVTAFVMIELARAEDRGLKVWKLIAATLVLCVITGLGWYVGQIEPDSMTAVATIALYLLAFRTAELGTARSILMLAVATVAVASHPAHLPLAAGLVAAIALLRVGSAAFAQMALPAPRVLVPAASLLLALALVLQSNHALTGKYFISKSGPVFAFARMLQDGLVKRELDETCPGSHYHLCAFKDRMPNRADGFLWDADSPFNKLERFNGPTDEYTRIVGDSIRRHPFANLAAALGDTARQFVKIRTGDQIEPQEWILYSDLAHYIPRQMNAYMSARQQQGELSFASLNVVHVTVGFASLLALAAMLWFAIGRRDWQSAVLPAFVLVALLGNAFVCGVFSNPHDRYQSRLIWVPTFVILISARKYGPIILANVSRIRQLMRDG